MTINPDSQTWLAIREWAQGRLDDLRLQNDGAHTEAKTALLRGKIAMLKDLLALPAKSLITPVEPNDPYL